MNVRISLILLAGLLCVTAACANKGKLLSPSQIAYQDEKKARRAQKKADKEAAQQKEDAAEDGTESGDAPDESPAAVKSPFN